jgi:hypothetical protein
MLKPSKRVLNLSDGVRPRYVTYWSPVGANRIGTGMISVSSLIGMGISDMDTVVGAFILLGGTAANGG